MAPTHLGHGSWEGPALVNPEFFWLASWEFSLACPIICWGDFDYCKFVSFVKEGREVLGWCGMVDPGAQYY